MADPIGIYYMPMVVPLTQMKVWYIFGLLFLIKNMDLVVFLIAHMCNSRVILCHAR